MQNLDLDLRCPQCHLPLIPAKAMNGGESEFWMECPKCNVYVNTYTPQDHQYEFHVDAHKYTGNFGG